MNLSPLGRARRTALALRAYTMLLLALCVIAFLGLLQGDFLGAGLTIAALLACLVGTAPAAIGIVACLLGGAYLSALLAVGMIAAQMFGRTDMGTRFDRRALAAETSFPAPLLEQLREVAAKGPITTRSMVALAAAQKPGVWEPWLERDPGEAAFDGPVLRAADGVECSQYAAESLVLADKLCESLQRPLDARTLGATAAMLPLSSASEWLKDRGLPETVLGVTPEQMIGVATAFSKTPAGADMTRRVESIARAGMKVGCQQREQLAKGGRGFLSGAASLGLGVTGVATVYAYLAVAGELVLDLLRWTVSLPLRAMRLPGRVRQSLRNRRRGRIRRSWRFLTAAWACWPVTLRLLWLCGRPSLGLAAAVCIAGFGSLPIWLATPVAVAVVAIRSVRRPWLPLAVAVATVPVSVPGALLLALRVLLGEAIVWGLGRGGGNGARQRGLEAVRAARLKAGGQLTGYPAESLPAARAAFSAAIDSDDEDAVLENATAYGVAAWAAWRWRELARLLRNVVRGVVRGDWSGPVEEAGLFDRELMSLGLIEELLEALTRWLALLTAAVVAFLALSSGGGLLGRHDLASQLVGAAAAALIASRLSQRRIEFFAAAFWIVLAWLALGERAWAVVAIAIAAAFAARALRRLGETLSFSGRARWRSWPAPRWRPWRLRRQWAAASKALDSGQERIGVEMLKELARDAGSDEAYVSAALGRAALVEVDLGRLQSAAAHLDQISPRSGELKGTAAVAAGMLANALGDFEAALPLLRDTLADLDGSSPLVPRATLALAEVLARTGDPDAALELVTGYGARPFALRGVAAILETQTVIAAALLERSRNGGEDKERAAKLLSQFDSFIGPEETELLAAGLDPAAMHRLQRVQAQLLALHGQLLLDQSPSEAALYLGRAVALAVEGRDEVLRAQAQVLHGAALARAGDTRGTSTISEGIEALEGRRVQLRRGERRTAMIAAGEVLYSAALSGYRAAQRRGDQGAGVEAAKLVESLRQSALAATLRAGPLPIEPEAQRTIGQVLRGERGGTDVDELRALVGEQISERFAATYLPTPVTAFGLLRACRGFDHVLAFHMPLSGGPAWRVWISSGGKAEVDTVGGSGAPTPLLTAITESGRLPEVEIHRPLIASAVAWEGLGEELFPLGMRQALLRADPERPQRVLLVPDRSLAMVPWAALRVGGRSLVESAVLQAVPALELAGSTELPRPAKQILTHLPEQAEGAELQTLRRVGGVEVVSDRDSFLGALDDRRFDGAYMASHGRLDGLRQEIEFADGSTLSAAGALAYEWPPWTVFSSCLVGRVDQVSGREPFGLAISCMLRGASTVLASVVELTELGALACGEATAALATGNDPAAALRAAQLQQLQSRRLTTLADGLGLVCISTAAAP